MDSQSSERITLDSLADLTGFPADLIKKELFDNSNIDMNQEISLSDLRAAMMTFIDETMLDGSDQISSSVDK